MNIHFFCHQKKMYFKIYNVCMYLYVYLSIEEHVGWSGVSILSSLRKTRWITFLLLCLDSFSGTSQVLVWTFLVCPTLLSVFPHLGWMCCFSIRTAFVIWSKPWVFALVLAQSLPGAQSLAVSRVWGFTGSHVLCHEVLTNQEFKKMFLEFVSSRSDNLHAL